MAPVGDLIQPRIDRPSSGNAARSVEECACTRRRFVLLSPTITQVATVLASQPRSRATTLARRRFRSTDPIRSLTSTISVFSSMTSESGCARATPGCRSPRARRRPRTRPPEPTPTPRSVANHRATDSCSAECRAFSSRSSSPPCRADDEVDPRTQARRRWRARSARQAQPAAHARAARSSKWTRRARSARSACRQRRLIRSALHTAPNRTTSMRRSSSARRIRHLSGTSCLIVTELRRHRLAQQHSLT